MSLRARMAVFVAAGVSLVLALVAILVFVAVRNQQHAQTVDALRQTTTNLDRVLAPSTRIGAKAERDASISTVGGAYIQLLTGFDAEVVTSAGNVIHLGRNGLTLPYVAQASAVARGARPAFVLDTKLLSDPLVILTSQIRPGYSLVLALSAASEQALLNSIARTLFAIAAGAIALTAAITTIAVSGALKPLRQLANTAGEVARTNDLSRRLGVRANDELSQIASEFNSMMAALEQSRRSQKQLVADASHELRTPLTAIRTNLEVLIAQPNLDINERRSIDAEILAQIQELELLISDLADLARHEAPSPDFELVELASIITGAAGRIGHRNPSIQIVCDLQEVVLTGDEPSLRRAVTNLIDNAAKWSPHGSKVQVSLSASGDEGLVAVRDHGPGFAAGDLPFVFDRFFRSRSARRMPGTGLGLAIVSQVAAWHGGSAGAENSPEGGAIVWMRLPLQSTPAEPNRLEAFDSPPAQR